MAEQADWSLRKWPSRQAEIDGNDQTERLAEKGSVTGGFRIVRSEILGGLRYTALGSVLVYGSELTTSYQIRERMSRSFQVLSFGQTFRQIITAICP